MLAQFPHACFPFGGLLTQVPASDTSVGMPSGPVWGIISTILLQLPWYKHFFAWMACAPASKLSPVFYRFQIPSQLLLSATLGGQVNTLPIVPVTIATIANSGSMHILASIFGLGCTCHVALHELIEATYPAKYLDFCSRTLCGPLNAKLCLFADNEDLFRLLKTSTGEGHFKPVRICVSFHCCRKTRLSGEMYVDITEITFLQSELYQRVWLGSFRVPPERERGSM